jgi:DnaJ-class molecular chaperone
MVRVEEPVAKCAFCKGTGKDLYKYPQALVTCPVCRGKGIVTSRESSIEAPHAGEKKGDRVEEEPNIASVFKYPMSRL